MTVAFANRASSAARCLRLRMADTGRSQGRPLPLSNRHQETSGTANNWQVVIGIETHAQLSTRSKIFSGASTAFGAEPNTQACAIDLALPGVLPVLNRAAETARSVSVWRSVPKWRRSRYLRARTTSTRTCRKAIRSASSNCRWWVANSRSRSGRPAKGRLREISTPDPCASGRRREIAARRLPGQSRESTSTVPAPLLRSLLSPICAHRPKPLPMRGTARAGALDRHLRRQHAGRLVPLRRQRFGTAPGRASSAPAARSRTSTRSASCSRRSTTRCSGRSTRSRKAGDPAGHRAVRPGQWRDADDALEGRRARLPLLP